MWVVGDRKHRRGVAEIVPTEIESTNGLAGLLPGQAAGHLGLRRPPRTHQGKRPTRLATITFCFTPGSSAKKSVTVKWGCHCRLA